MHKPKMSLFILSSLLATPIFAQYTPPPAPISISPAWTLEKNQAASSFGSSVAGAGDVNGDGYADVIIGVKYYDKGESNEGIAVLYLGSAAGISGSPSWYAESNQADAFYGTRVASAGDVNSDGYSDVIIGAPGYDNGESGEGKAYLYLGGPTGLSTTPVWTAEGNAIHASFGLGVSGAGDVNGDGYDDIIVGASDITYEGSSYSGAAYIFYGNPDGVSDVADWEYSEWDSDSNYGYAVSSAGDVNGDGYDDIIIGAHTTGWDGPGVAYVYLGSAGGIVTPYHWIDGGGYDAAYFGKSVTSGDYNADGYSDIAIGAPNWVIDYWSGETIGRVSVYYGSSTGLTSTDPDWAVDDQTGLGSSLGSGDFNNDGYDDILAGLSGYTNDQAGEGAIFVYTGGPDGIPGATTWASQSNQVSAELGSSVASAGDVNGDGFDDMLVGAPSYDNGQTDEGQARIYLGSAGCVTPPVVTVSFPDDLLCVRDSIFTIVGGSPAGGVYTGTGVVGTNQFDPSAAGVGTHVLTYTYTAPGGCSATASDFLTIEANPSVSLYLGSASTDLCVSNPVVLVGNYDPALTYQWFRNGSPLPGETYLALLAYTTGSYQLQTTNAAGCSTFSKRKKVSHTGCRIGEEITWNAEIFPNPNTGNFTIVWPDVADNAEVLINIYDISGREIVGTTQMAIGGFIELTLQKTITTGMYVMHLQSDAKNVTMQLIIME